MSCNPPDLPDSQQRSDALGQEITKLFGLITAATYDLLVRIRQFDQEKLWHLEGQLFKGPCHDAGGHAGT
jgi:hypothetical protein